MRLLSWLFPKRTSEAVPEFEPAVNPTVRPAITTATAERSGLGVPDGDYRFVAVDVETANSDSASICQIGLAFVGQDNRISTFSTLIDPTDGFAAFNVKLHGIDDEAVRGKPTFDKVFAELIPVFSRNILVQHSSFDEKAIEGACRAYGISPPKFRWLDSVQIARRAWPELKGPGGGHGLGNLKKVLALEFKHHDAGEDARAAADVVLRAELDTGRSFTDLATSNARASKRYEKNVALDGDPRGPLHGHVAVFTGTLSMSREDAALRAAKCGVAVRSTVTKKTTVLVVGDQDPALLAGHRKSGKHRRAEELIAKGQDIRIVTESAFIKMTRPFER